MDKEDNIKIVTDNKSYRLLAEALKIFKQHDADGSGIVVLLSLYVLNEIF